MSLPFLANDSKKIEEKVFISTIPIRSTFNQLIKKLGSLAFLPLPEVESTFFSKKKNCLLTLTILHLTLRPHLYVALCCALFTAVERKFIHLQNSQIKEWNVYEEIDRTSNVCEAFNRRIKCFNFKGDHPSMNSLISLLLRIHQQQEHIAKGCPPKKAKKCDRQI